MAAISDSSGKCSAIDGRTTLETNPLTLSLIESIDHMRDLGGTGLLLDENNRIIYSSEISQPLTIFKNERHSEAIFYDDTATDGTRQLVYYQPVIGHPWAIVLSVPAQQAQQIALDIAMPLSLMIILLALGLMISLRVGLGAVTGSLGKGLQSKPTGSPREILIIRFKWKVKMRSANFAARSSKCVPVYRSG